MSSIEHEALIQMLRQRPALAAEVLSDGFGIDVPTFRAARLASGELNEVIPTEYRADAVVTLTDGNGPALAVVVEAQLGKDRSKRRSWPVYLAALHARLDCPTMLLVVCAKPDVAAWCRAGIDIGHPDWILKPLVLGPGQVPVVTDIEQARRAPEVAVLSAMAHAGSQPDGDKVLSVLPAALATFDPDHFSLYARVVMAALPAAAKRHLRHT